jgi:tRNA(adenine34) deaminase
MTPDAFIFDLFGTLVNTFSLRLHEDAMSRMAAAPGVPRADFAFWWTDTTWPPRVLGTLERVEDNVAYICRGLGVDADDEWIATAPESKNNRFSQSSILGIRMNTDRYYLQLALDEAEQAAREGTHPIGAVVVDRIGIVLSRGRNRVYSTGDVTAHAEIDALRRAGRSLMEVPHQGLCTVYTSLEPCLMCTGALVMARIARVVWAANDDYYGGLRQLHEGPLCTNLFSRLGVTMAVTAAPDPDLAQRQRELLAFWDNGRGRDGSIWLHPSPAS